MNGIISLALQTPGCLPPLLWGTFGTAKSAVIAQIASRLGWHLETVIASVRAPEDFGGVAIPDGDGVRRIPDAWVTRASAAAKAGRKVLVFFDEISCAPPAVQAALLRGLLEGVWGDISLDPAAVRYVAAANPPDEAAGGWEMARPLAGRFVHIHWTPPTLDEWADYLSGGQGKAHLGPVLDPQKWASEWPKARGIICGFLRRFPHFFVEDEAKDPSRFPPAFGRPRTWESAGRLLTAARAAGVPQSVFDLVSGAVGKPAATELVKYVENCDIPDPEELLRDPGSWVPNMRREDIVYATLAAVTAAVAGSNSESYPSRWEAGWALVGKVIEAGGSGVAAVAARALAGKPPSEKPGAFLTPAVKEIVKRLRPVLEASGISA